MSRADLVRESSHRLLGLWVDSVPPWEQELLSMPRGRGAAPYLPGIEPLRIGPYDLMPQRAPGPQTVQCHSFYSGPATCSKPTFWQRVKRWFR